MTTNIAASGNILPLRQELRTDDEVLEKILDDLVSRREDQDFVVQAANSNICAWQADNSAIVTSESNNPLIASHGSLATSAVRPELRGGTYQPDEALALLNAWFFLAREKGAYPIAQIEGHTIKYISSQDFKTKLANMFVQVDDGRGGMKRVKAETFWLAHEQRQEREIIFNPKASPGAEVEGNYNLWRGYAISPRHVTGRHRTLLRHLREVICRNDKASFKYLLFWLAWSVQNPHKNPETAVVLKSAEQGTGKTTLNYVMSRIFGEHARTIADKQRLFDRFNADLQTAVFIDADEMLWAGDRGSADALKSLITSQTLTLEVKHGSRWQIPNRLHIIMTTNHEHAVQSGVHDRRFFVLDVSAHKAQDADWFEPLYDDLDNGGVEEFLWLLQRVKLTGWHPRRLPKTNASIEQQRFSEDSVSQWAQACIDADAIVGGVTTRDLNSVLATHVLYDAYKGYCRSHPVNPNVFGKALTQMFGQPTRQNVRNHSGSSRPRTYCVPDADTWQLALDKRLGIGK